MPQHCLFLKSVWPEDALKEVPDQGISQDYGEKMIGKSYNKFKMCTY